MKGEAPWPDRAFGQQRASERSEGLLASLRTEQRDATKTSWPLGLGVKGVAMRGVLHVLSTELLSQLVALVPAPPPSCCSTNVDSGGSRRSNRFELRSSFGAEGSFNFPRSKRSCKCQRKGGI